MEQKRPKPEYLKVIKGKGTVGKRTAEHGKKPIYFLLLFLALFLLAQILFGWIWGNVDQDAINTVLAGEGFTDVSFPAAGVITFSEKVVLAPRSGFVYYKISEGERVPVGKELAGITEFPLEEEVEIDYEEPGVRQYFQHLKDWFLGETNEDLADYFPADEEVKVVSPLPGLVDFGLDGFEKFGPDSHFPYLTPEEFAEKAPQEQALCSGEKVLRSTPLLKLINNYYWYFSAVLPPEHGRLLPENSEDKLIFSFAPDIPVWGRKLESRERDDGKLEITWCIDRELPGLYDRRWDSVEIVYKNLEGVLIPKSALLEIEAKKGVYVIENGLVTFREIIVLTERENEYLVKNLELYERVVTQPESVKEGQSFYW